MIGRSPIKSDGLTREMPGPFTCCITNWSLIPPGVRLKMVACSKILAHNFPFDGANARFQAQTADKLFE
jgi:hypothetical protein